jgi:rSAM-associated Gly-rich repeat protein
MIKRENAGLLGVLLALASLGAPKADAALVPAPDASTVEGRLTRLTAALHENERYLTLAPTADAVYVGYGFLNAAPSFRNASHGWVNRVGGWYNTGPFYNSGLHFLNNAPSFRNAYGGWVNRVHGWINSGGSGFRNGGGFANGGSFRNGGGGGAFRNGGGGGFFNR